MNQPAYTAGHAFPTGFASEHGMTLRDYYVAHAPREPQPWFKPVMLSPRPPTPDQYNELSEAQRREWENARDGGRDSDDPAVIAFMQRRRAA